MRRRVFATSAAVLAVGVPVALPATTGAVGTGGGTAVPTTGTFALRAGAATMLGHVVRIAGSVAPADAERVVLVQRRAGSGWVVVVRTHALPDGRFVARWRADHTGRVVLRAVVPHARRIAAAASAVAFARVTVYRPMLATWYGPGFYGSRTACGRRLTRRTLGVAHRSLPCGTKVAIYYRGRSLVVPVIDRGPFGGAASFDLTGATAAALGFAGSGSIGTLAPR